MYPMALSAAVIPCPVAMPICLNGTLVMSPIAHTPWADVSPSTPTVISPNLLVSTMPVNGRGIDRGANASGIRRQRLLPILPVVRSQFDSCHRRTADDFEYFCVSYNLHLWKLRNSLSEIRVACKIIGDYNRDHFSGVFGERKDILQSRIAPANDCNLIVFEERSIRMFRKKRYPFLAALLRRTGRFLRVAPVAMIIARVKNTMSPVIICAVSLYILPAASATETIEPFTMERYSGNFLSRFSKNASMPSWKILPDTVGTNGQLVISGVLFIWPPTSGPTAITLRWAFKQIDQCRQSCRSHSDDGNVEHLFLCHIFHSVSPLSSEKPPVQSLLGNNAQASTSCNP